MAEATRVHTDARKYDRVIGVCHISDNPFDPESAVNVIAPAKESVLYFWQRERRKITGQPTISILRLPAHGVLQGPVNGAYVYDPEPGFIGNDRASLQVQIGETKVRMEYFFRVMENISFLYDENTPDPYERGYCPVKARVWRISSGFDGQSVAGGYSEKTSPITLNISSLFAGTLAETNSATITLDTTAAGHGWFIDSTPSDNAEFLPTSHPNEWIARPGSEADGKMDMLTVLLHEYGHTLGLDHSVDAHDFMASPLQPGVRRTLSVDEELTLMRLAGVFITPESPSEPYAPNGPTDPGVPLPFTRINGTARYSRLRRIDGLAATGLASESTVPQYDIAANPTLAGLADGAGWSTTGEVSFASGAATLAETVSTQTRLNQVFVVGPNDRYLTFTVANAALGDQLNGPDDAFEVALIDATTGRSLLGGTGLTHSDAVINRQADGSEHDASGINVVSNADGSRTYLIDLSGIAAGTAVNLALDLIGFGRGLDAQNSHLTIRELHLGLPESVPQAKGELVTRPGDAKPILLSPADVN